jgi:hypothetical protein
MTEVEKMFENAGIKPLCQLPDKFCGVQNIYEDFTAEKQIEIIKLISKQGQVIIENWEKDNKGFNVTFRANSNLRYITMDCITRKTVEEALAQIINDIWQDLTDQEKEEIRNILNA